MTWVFDHSPYTLGSRLIHLAIADIVNDDNDWLLWASKAKIAKKAKVSHPTVTATFKKMVEEGFLELVEERRGAASTYRFLRPTPQKSEWLDDEDLGGTPQNAAVQPPKSTEADLLLTQEEQKLKRKRAQKQAFALFWEAYPPRNGKRLHKDVAWDHFKDVPVEEWEALLVGARFYAEACSTGLMIAKDPYRWVRDGNWVDWQTPAVADSIHKDGHAEEMEDIMLRIMKEEGREEDR